VIVVRETLAFDAIVDGNRGLMGIGKTLTKIHI